MEKYDVCIMYQLYSIVTVEAENEDDVQVERKKKVNMPLSGETRGVVNTSC